MEDSQSQEHEDLRLGRLRQVLQQDSVLPAGPEEDDVCEGARSDLAGDVISE